VEIQVRDTGTGMPPEVAARAMDPFFTTKAIGKGTGLGLAMAYATAKSHSGTLAIHSEKDKGTTVSLRLPAWRGELPGPRAAEGSSEDSEPLRILLVDDDDLIRAAVPNMLRARGHHVATAPGGAEGLARLDAGPPVDLVILDLNMPGMNGIETHGLIRRRWRTLPILLATGHLDTRTSELLEADGHILSIAKPYSMDELVGKLNDLRAMT
jgi:CheY-like chemotaxis protein